MAVLLISGLPIVPGQEGVTLHRSENLDRLHFFDHFVLNDQIGPKTGIDANTYIDNRDPLLAREELVSERNHVG